MDTAEIPEVTENDIVLPHDFEPRGYQEPVFSDMLYGDKSRAMLVWHRRAGKDKTMLNFVSTAMMQRVGAYYYFFPKLKQARKAIWDGTDRYGMKYLDHFPKKLILGNLNNTEMKFWFKHPQDQTRKGSLFQLCGSDNFNDVMGTNPIGIVFSEFSLQDPDAWNFFQPILRENGGWAIFIFTPRGKNHAYDLYEKVKNNPNWLVQVLTVKDTFMPDGRPVLTEADIQEDIDEGMTEDMVQQEYYVSFDRGISGTFYGKDIQLARDEERVRKVDADPYFQVDTFWDLGVTDDTTIWFVQFIHREIHVVDYYEASGEGLRHFADVLVGRKEKYKYLYGKHYGPHDISAKRFGVNDSRSIKEMAKDVGINFTKVPRNVNINQGIQKVRSILGRCYFDEKKCEKGLKSLESYHRAYDKEKKCYLERPVHNWASHGADGFRTLAEAIQSSGAGGRQGQMTAEEVKELRKKNRPASSLSA